MNEQLQNALAELRQAQALGLPEATVIEVAPDGSSWNGKKADGTHWSMTKHSADKFTCIC